jgi:hypothetical protein
VKKTSLAHIRAYRKKGKLSFLIQDYLGGELKGDKLVDFISRMLSDPEFADEVDLYRNIDTFLTKKFDHSMP